MEEQITSMIEYEHIPTEILGLIESYLLPSDCAHLSATCTVLNHRWSGVRWMSIFQLHYGHRNQLRNKERTMKLRKARRQLIKFNREHGLLYNRHTTHGQKTSLYSNAPLERDERETFLEKKKSKQEHDALFATYDEHYKEGWEFTFVGCCHDDNGAKCKQCSCKSSSGGTTTCCDDNNVMSADNAALTTQFNVTALVPSMKRLYVDLWDTIELSLLGYYDAQDEEGNNEQHRNNNNFLLHPTTHHSQYPVPAIMRVLKTSVLPELAEYLYFVVGFKPLAGRGNNPRRRRRDGGVMGPVLSRRMSEDVTDYQRIDTVPVDSNATLDEVNSLRDAATTMSAWKLACFLRQRGVGCLRCAICDRIDLMGDEFEDYNISGDESHEEGLPEEGDDSDEGEIFGTRRKRKTPFLREFQRQIHHGAWMTPCQCPDLVHRQCLEQKLNLTVRWKPWERFKVHLGSVWAILCNPKKKNGEKKTHTISLTSSSPHANEKESIAQKVWIAYDNRMHHQEDEDSIIAIDQIGRFRSPTACCEICGWQYVRVVRLPRSKWEVLAASLSDPISLLRALSTFVHFIFVCVFLAACEGMCSEVECSTHRTLLSTPLGELKWPTSGLNGFALAFWQLWQCCMLHIFFSERFAAIVDRLWMGPISFFYCRLYFYFVLTSAMLTASYIPMVTRSIRKNFLELFVPSGLLDMLQPLGNAIALANLFQYAVVSTTVICIFWRTHYRIFTVADGNEAAAMLRRREDLTRDTNGGQVAALHGAGPVALPLNRIVGIGAGDNNAANHPIYHGPW